MEETTNPEGKQPPAGNLCLAPAGSAGRNKKTYFGQNLAPIQRIPDLTVAFFFPAA
jgi:hypothetical protein